MLSLVGLLPDMRSWATFLVCLKSFCLLLRGQPRPLSWYLQSVLVVPAVLDIPVTACQLQLASFAEQPPLSKPYNTSHCSTSLDDWSAFVEVYIVMPLSRQPTVSTPELNIGCQSFWPDSNFHFCSPGVLDTEKWYQSFTCVQRSSSSFYADFCIASENISRSAVPCSMV